MTALIHTLTPLAQIYTGGEIGTAQEVSVEDQVCAARIQAALQGYITSPLTLGELEQLLVDGIAAARRRSTDETAMILRTAADNATHSLGMSVREAVSSLDAVSERIRSDVGKTVHEAVHAALDPSVPNAPLASVTGAVNTVSQHVTDTVFRTTNQVMEAVNTLRTDVVAQRAEEEARAEERSKSSAKGQDFEDYLEDLLGEFAVKENLVLVSTAKVEGSLKGCKKGDFLFTNTNGDVMFVVEAKDNIDRGSEAKIHIYLDETCRNRNTKLAVWAVNGAAQNKNNAFTRLTDQRWVASAAENDRESFFLVLHILLTMAKVTAAGNSVSAGNMETARRCVQSAVTSLDALRKVRLKLSDMDKITLGIRELVTSMENDVTVPLNEAVVALSGGNVPIEDETTP